MTSSMIFFPVLAQVLLTLLLFVLLLIRKGDAVKEGRVDREETALDNKKWPSDVVQVSNNIANQFEIPTLFYVLCLVFFSLNEVSTSVVTLAWLFVVSRYVHAFVHVTSNYVPVRMKMFSIGVITLLILTVKAFLVLFA